jgi:hypothetical protein
MSAARRATDIIGIQYTMLTNSIVTGFDKNRILIYNKPEIYHKQQKHMLYSKIINIWHKYAHPDVLAIGEAEITSKLNGKSLQCYSPSLDNSRSQELNSIIERIDRKKSLVALFVSSNDEANAIQDWLEFYNLNIYNQENRYPSQWEWLEDWLSSADSLNIQFILRMHPRIGIDHRSTSRSVDHQKWHDLGANFQEKDHIVIYPESDISSYIIPYLVTQNVISWSSIGQELALLGFQVSQAFSQPNGIVNFPKNSSFLPYRPSIDDYVRSVSTNEPQDILNTIGSAAVFYGWYRGLSSYRLLNSNVDVDDYNSPLVKEISEVITGKIASSEENHFERFSSYLVQSESEAPSIIYANLKRYIKISLNHALSMNDLINMKGMLSNDSSAFFCKKISKRIQLLAKAISIIKD